MRDQRLACGLWSVVYVRTWVSASDLLISCENSSDPAIAVNGTPFASALAIPCAIAVLPAPACVCVCVAGGSQIFRSRNKSSLIGCESVVRENEESREEREESGGGNRPPSPLLPTDGG